MCIRDRYANVAELAAALAPFAPKRARGSVGRIARVIESGGRSDSPMALPPSSNPSAEPSGPATMASWGQADARDRRNRVAGAIGITAAVCLSVGAFAATWFVQRSAPDAAKAAGDQVGNSAAPSAADITAAPPVGVNAPSPAASGVSEMPTPQASPGATTTTASTSDSPAPTRSRAAAPRATSVAPAAAPKAPASAPTTAASASRRKELGGRL